MYDTIRVPPPPPTHTHTPWDLTLSPLYQVKLSTLSSVIILMDPNIGKYVDLGQTVSLEGFDQRPHLFHTL